MTLNYDFDMIAAIPKTIFDDPDAGRFLDEMEFQNHQKGNVTALFRDPATIAALERAPQGVQDYLRASAFGVNSYHSGAPAGRYPDLDENARIMVIEALAKNVSRFDLPPGDDTQPVEGAFHLPAFFAAVAEAEPIQMDTGPAPDAAPPGPDAIIADASIADAIIADAMAADARAAGASIADAMAADGMVADAIALDVNAADADANALPPPHARRFRMPSLPRWLTAGAALAVLGVAFGTAII